MHWYKYRLPKVSEDMPPVARLITSHCFYKHLGIIIVENIMDRRPQRPPEKHCLRVQRCAEEKMKNEFHCLKKQRSHSQRSGLCSSLNGVLLPKQRNDGAELILWSVCNCLSWWSSPSPHYSNSCKHSWALLNSAPLNHPLLGLLRPITPSFPSWWSQTKPYTVVLLSHRTQWTRSYTCGTSSYVVSKLHKKNYDSGSCWQLKVVLERAEALAKGCWTV